MALPDDTLSALYSPPGDEWTEGHIEAMIHLAAGYQFKEAGVAEHLRRIAAYVGILAEAMELPPRRLELLRHACLFHDVGMVDVPESIVLKSDALDDAETRLMRKHTELGHDLLEAGHTPLMQMAASLALTHHERYNGSGYPRALESEDIPLGARILSVADVFDALTTSRPFKEAYPFEVAFEIVQSMSGTHFDPRVTAAMKHSREELARASERLSTDRPPSRRGFRISARDRSRGDLFSIARDGYFSCPFCKNLHPRSVDVCPQAGIQLQDIHKLSGLVVDDRYRLRDALGVGGMGTVYEAVHMLIDRALAIKFLEPALARQRESLERFYNEARVFSTVGHPNLVEVTDMGITPEGLPYMVMEKLEGIDLARLMFTRKVLPTIAAVTLAIEVLRTLEAVHAKGIVHRDLKPENVFLSGDPGEETLKILDFGISRLIPRSGEDRRLTQKGIVFGTPQYMSPEQAWGRDEIDHRSDLFTVGEILYEMITGRPVFEGDNNLAVLSAVTRAEIASPRRIRPSIPEALDRIVMTALSKEPADRFADAGRFADALEELAREDERWAPGRILDLGEEGPAPAPARDGRSRTDPGIPPAPKPG